MPLSFHHLPQTITNASPLASILERCKAGDLNDAKYDCIDHVDSNPNNVATKHLLAILEFETGQRDEALERLDVLIDDVQHDASLHSTLGHMFLEMEMVPEAEAAYLQAFDIDANDFDAHWNLGNLMQLMRRMTEAEQYYRHATVHHPDNGNGHLSLGTLMLAIGQPEDARISLERAADLLQDHFGCLNNLGIALMGCARHLEAEAMLLRALEIKENDSTVLYHLGKLKYETGDHKDAEDYYKRALTFEPANPMHILGMAQVLVTLRRSDEAQRILQSGVEHMPRDGSLRTQLALVQLRRGEYAQGWLNFEGRRPEPPMHRRLQALPLWRGETLDKKRLLVTSEGSLGDVIHFLRYLQSFVVLGRDFALEVRDDFLPLLSNNKIGVPIIGESEKQENFDLVTRLMSLPLLLGQQRPFWPATGPYLEAGPKLKKEWGSRIADMPGRRVVIALSSSSAQSLKIQANALESLAQVDNISLISLCDREMTAELKSQSWSDCIRFVDDQMDPTNWIENYAAVLENVDLLIASDGDIVHVASAIGIPTWVLLGAKPNWRWGETSEKCDHYPDVRLFRQDMANDSSATLGRIAALLTQFD